MPNPFDTFDEKSVTGTNVFDQFESGKNKDTKPWINIGDMVRTLTNIGRVYPVAETAANLATSLYGVPISGLVGLAALPAGLENSGRAMEAVQKFLIYQPQTKHGSEFSEATTYPLRKYKKIAGTVGKYVEGRATPEAGALAESIVESIPVMVGGRKMFVSPNVKRALKRKTVVESGIDKAIRPSVAKKEFYSQRSKYMQNARMAVDEIIKNKKNLELFDKDGMPVSGRLPQTLGEFSQAIEQTKRKVFDTFDSLAKQADTKGATVPTKPIIGELGALLKDKVLQSVSPETIDYALARIETLKNKVFTTSEAQKVIQILNQTNEAFYKDPTPKMMGRAYVDNLIANNLRAGTDAAIQNSIGFEYAPLKRKYGALRMLETDVTKRAIVDSRKNIKGLIDFSDIFSSSQVTYGLTTGQPALLASGATAKMVAALYKHINNPNRIVKSTFRQAEKLNKRTRPFTGKHGGLMFAGGIISAQIKE